MELLCWVGVIAVGFVLYMLLLKWIIHGPTFKSSKRLDGMTAVVTGANTGIGLVTAKNLAERGARVLILCRNITKGGAAVNTIKTDLGKSAKVAVVQCDLSSMKSIRACAEKIMNEESRLDLLVLNAGVMMSPLSPRTADGFEIQIGTNHFGHFLLTRLLAPLLRKTVSDFNGKPRVVVVSSAAHMGAMERLRTHDLNFEKEPGQFSPMKAYSQSKMANVLFARELGERLRDSGITTYSLHPGVIATELNRHISESTNVFARLFDIVGYKIGGFVIKTPLQGAQTTLYCCLDDGIANETGRYYDACKPKKPSAYARNREDGRKLWEISEELTGCKDLPL